MVLGGSLPLLNIKEKQRQWQNFCWAVWKVGVRSVISQVSPQIPNENKNASVERGEREQNWTMYIIWTFPQAICHTNDITSFLKKDCEVEQVLEALEEDFWQKHSYRRKRREKSQFLKNKLARLSLRDT